MCFAHCDLDRYKIKALASVWNNGGDSSAKRQSALLGRLKNGKEKSGK